MGRSWVDRDAHEGDVISPEQEGRRSHVDVLLVDDHALVREGMRTVLDAEEDLRVVGEAGTAHEALALTRHLRPDLIVLDIRLPDRDGVEICSELRDISPTVRILVCSGMTRGSSLVDAAAAGADGFVSKEAPNAEIVDAARRVAAGATVVGGESADAIFRDSRKTALGASKLSLLSARERQVLGLLSLGLTNREIAGRLHLAEKTVRNQVSNVLRKLGYRHRTEAALFAAPLRGELDLPD